MGAPAGYLRTTDTISSWARSSSSRSRNSGLARRNSWIRSDAPQGVAELFRLGPRGAPVQVVGRRLDGKPLHDGEAVALEAHELARVVGQEAHPAHAQLREDLRADPVFALVGLEAERLVGLDGVLALVLELVGHDLVDEA